MTATRDRRRRHDRHAGDTSADRPTTPAPVVHLVGAGPAGVDLLTVRAARLIRSADVVLHDQLVTSDVLALARAATLVPVGRRAGRVVADHAEVVERMVREARAGRHVVRLKGGDPVVFGRGGEEALDLARHGVVAEVVPGVTSAVAAPELAGIPLTHRGVATGALILTGCRADGGGLAAADAAAAGSFAGTVVVLMAATRLEAVCGQLRAAGLVASTPAAVVARAGRADQQVVSGDLVSLPVIAAGVGTPAVLVVGEVVGVRHQVAATLAGPLAHISAGVPGGADLDGSVLVGRLP